MFKQMMQELRKDFKGESIKVLLLCVLLSIYPLLAELGFGISLPLAVVIDSERTLPKLAKQLIGFSSSPIVPITSTPKQLNGAMYEAKYGICLFRFGENRYTQWNLETIASKCQQVESDISKVRLNLMFVVEKIPRKYQHLFQGAVYIKEAPQGRIERPITNEKFFREIILFCQGHIPEIKNLGARIAWEGNGFDTLVMAAESLKLFAELQGLAVEEVEKLRGEINQTLDEMSENWESAEEPGAYAVAFRQALYNYVGEITDVFEREHLPGDAIRKQDMSLLYDADFYYISYTLFCKVSEKLAGVENLDYIKGQLVDAGTIIGEGNGRSYFTKKIEVVTSYGNIMRWRLVKMPMEKIDIPGELTFRERIIAEREGEENGNSIGEDRAPIKLCEDPQRRG